MSQVFDDDLPNDFPSRCAFCNKRAARAIMMEHFIQHQDHAAATPGLQHLRMFSFAAPRRTATSDRTVACQVKSCKVRVGSQRGALELHFLSVHGFDYGTNKCLACEQEKPIWSSSVLRHLNNSRRHERRIAAFIAGRNRPGGGADAADDEDDEDSDDYCEGKDQPLQKRARTITQKKALDGGDQATNDERTASDESDKGRVDSDSASETSSESQSSQSFGGGAHEHGGFESDSDRVPSAHSSDSHEAAEDERRSPAKEDDKSSGDAEDDKVELLLAEDLSELLTVKMADLVSDCAACGAVQVRFDAANVTDIDVRDLVVEAKSAPLFAQLNAATASAATGLVRKLSHTTSKLARTDKDNLLQVMNRFVALALTDAGVGAVDASSPRLTLPPNADAMERLLRQQEPEAGTVDIEFEDE